MEGFLRAGAALAADGNPGMDAVLAIAAQHRRPDFALVSSWSSATGRRGSPGVSLMDDWPLAACGIALAIRLPGDHAG